MYTVCRVDAIKQLITCFKWECMSRTIRVFVFSNRSMHFTQTVCLFLSAQLWHVRHGVLLLLPLLLLLFLLLLTVLVATIIVGLVAPRTVCRVGASIPSSKIRTTRMHQMSNLHSVLQNQDYKDVPDEKYKAEKVVHSMQIRMMS